MALTKHPKRVNDRLRPKFGIPGILGQSDTVVKAFGPEKGYRLMLTTIYVRAFVGLVVALMAGQGIADMTHLIK
jgi:hypothetical protein